MKTQSLPVVPKSMPRCSATNPRVFSLLVAGSGRGFVGIVTGLLLLAGCGEPASKQNPESAASQDSRSEVRILFQERKDWLSRPIIYQNGEAAKRNAILESLGGGVAVFDLDCDGRLDLCFPGGGTFAGNTLKPAATAVLRQNDEGRFEEVSVLAGCAQARHYTHGCAAADYNHDGFPDLLITGYGGLELWENQGDGTFTDRTEQARLTDDQWSSSAGWGDLNGDGDLDLYVAHYVNWSFENHPPCQGSRGVPDVCPPLKFQGLDDEIYLSTGDGRFRAAGKELGLAAGGKGLGVLLADLDGNATLDVYVANDTTNNFFYVNTGDRLEERGVFNGLAVDDQGNANGSMGITLTDYNADTRADLWVTNYEDEMFALYRNEGDLLFVHSSAKAGLRNLGTVYVGFGCVSGDYDQDGSEDIAIANGHVIHHPRNAPVLQKPLLLRNRQGQFQIGSEDCGEYFASAHAGRGLAQGDFDRDGDLDLVFVNTLQPAALLFNETETTGRSLQVKLVGRQSNRSAIGANLLLETDQSRQVRWIAGGGSYLSSSDQTAHFGLPRNASVNSLSIQWPNGVQTKLDSRKWMGNAEWSRCELIIVEPGSEEGARIIETILP